MTLSIRNTDPAASIALVSAAYHDSDGKLIRTYVDKPVILGPLSSTRYVVKESDKTGGSGASFLVRWKSDKPVIPPVLEAIMIGTSQGQGISFVSRGIALTETP